MKTPKPKRYAVFLDGPIGVGKSTYGRHLAREFAGKFLDGDDYSKPRLPWYASSLSTNKNILNASLAALEAVPIVFVAYPIRCINWIFFKRRLQEHQIEAIFVGLHAPLTSISNESRNRRFSVAELARSAEMISQGYGSRRFSDFFVQTDVGDEIEVVKLATLFLKEKLQAPM